MIERTSELIYSDIKGLVNSKGYIYALCLLIMDDFLVDVERMDKIDVRSKMSKNEIQFLLGFLIQRELSFDPPDDPLDLLKLKKKTYELMRELHQSTTIPFVKKISDLIKNPHAKRASTAKNFFLDEGMFIEPIFYAGDGLYDFQYLEFLDRKYKYDELWLNANANFYFDEVKSIVSRIKSIQQEKTGRLNFLGLKEKRNEILENLKKEKAFKKIDPKEVEDFFDMMEFKQYDVLFETETHIANGSCDEEITLNGWKSFYKNLVDIFVFRKTDFDKGLRIDAFLEKFSLPISAINRNKDFQKIGDFNQITIKPIIQINPEQYFIIMPYSLFEAVYESPFYWMWQDRSYRTQLADNRGKASELIVFHLLLKVFGTRQVFKSVKIVTRKGFDDTDIDVLCILGSKVLCVQVKSKKLTQLSRRGDLNQLKADFKGAVQDAYDQGVLSKKKILEKEASFYDEHGKLIALPEEINEVFVMVVTTENYPSLAHQARTFLDKEEKDAHALTLSVFDLDLISFYLKNPYDFLYYVRQRIRLMESFYGDEEMYFLGYHLLHKLWPPSDGGIALLDNEYGQFIDKNYYLGKLGIELPGESDKIKSRWRNSYFEALCDQIGQLNFPKRTDTIFYLMDWSADARDDLMNKMVATKAKTIEDGRIHTISLISSSNIPSFGITFVSWNNNSTQELSKRLFLHCQGRKYKSKASAWIGLGALRESAGIIDVLAFNDEEWRYDEALENQTKTMFEGKAKGTFVLPVNKVGRNDPCPCGSGKKYKKCCGK